MHAKHLVSKAEIANSPADYILSLENQYCCGVNLSLQQQNGVAKDTLTHSSHSTGSSVKKLTM